MVMMMGQVNDLVLPLLSARESELFTLHVMCKSLEPRNEVLLPQFRYRERS